MRIFISNLIICSLQLFDIFHKSPFFSPNITILYDDDQMQ